MLEEMDKDFMMKMWDLREEDFFTDSRNVTVIAPNEESQVSEICMFFKDKYKIRLHKRPASRFSKEFTLVGVITKATKTRKV